MARAICRWALVALLPMVAGAADRGTLAGTSFGARFTLDVSGAAGPPDRSEGWLFLLADGRVCVRVDQPIRQDMLLSRERVLIHYPDRSLVLTGEVRGGQLPPAFEAILAGLGEPSRLLPGGSELVERLRDGAVLRSRWRLPAGADGGEVRVAEGADGVQSMEVRGADGRIRRRYDFGGRVKVGRLRLPTTLRGDYRGKSGEPVRTEAWTLAEVSPAVPPATARECAGEGARVREPLPW